ncbi:MAG: PilZ domain-containing protein [Pseudobdellovibrionaceae bacterium]|nr:PilZ domain-containing protein [Pseudobdellovibrionaceae bacterium]
MDRWFIYYQGQVKGPFDTNQVQELKEARQGLIWGRPFPEWYTFEKWQNAIKTTDSTQILKTTIQRKWKVKTGKEEAGPFHYGELVDYLKSLDNPKEAKIWTEGYKDWQPLFAFHKILDDLGIGRRAHPRVPISGKVKIKSLSGTQEGNLISISEGGLGVKEVSLLHVGDEVHISIQSDKFYLPINATGEVVYIDSEQMVGIKFTRISNEMRNAIIEYVRNYLEKKPILS